MQQQVELQVDDDIQCVMRYGALRDPNRLTAETYLLDYDLYNVEPRRFAATAILDLADRLNETALALFQLSLTDSYLKTLRKEGHS